MTQEEIFQHLPYKEPFLFVDELHNISEDQVIGSHLFRENAFFYQGHFKDYPVTPGVILTECMAQIGLVCLGILLIKGPFRSGFSAAMTHSDIEFLHPVFPGERVMVHSDKEYFRFNKLKCKVKMVNSEEKIVAMGTISGMFRS